MHTEPDLFPDSPPIRMARRMDPHTSHEAAWRFFESGSRSSQHGRILTTMLEGGMDKATASEIEAHLARYGYRIRAHKRMPELEREGYIQRGATRVCKVTGMEALTWELR